MSKKRTEVELSIDKTWRPILKFGYLAEADKCFETSVAFISKQDKEKRKTIRDMENKEKISPKKCLEELREMEKRTERMFTKLLDANNVSMNAPLCGGTRGRI